MLPYRLLRPALFALPPEAAHHLGTRALVKALSSRGARRAAAAQFTVRDPGLETECFGIRFPNPVGLAAGFDKAGEAFNALGALGFGHVEIGTVTAQAQPGNPQPRLFRLPADGALLNRMGFNNPGAEAVAAALAGQEIEPILGINLGKSKATPLEEAPADYLRSLELLEPFARYLVVNVSSPNTPGLRALQDAAPLRELLSALMHRLRETADAGRRRPTPLLLKIAPDLSDAQVEEAVGIAAEQGLAGIIATNTTVSRDGLHTPAGDVAAMGTGGISGAPVHRRAVEVVGRVWRTTEGRLPIIGVGGVFDARQAWAMVEAGASLVQVWTGFVYQGPTIARDINTGMLSLMHRAGLRRVADAVGVAHG